MILRRQARPFIRETAVWIGIGLLLAMAAGCRHQVPPVELPSRGTAGFKFVEETVPATTKAGEATAEIKSGDYFVEARPVEPLAAPVYPAELLRAKVSGVATLGVRIDVGADGRVTEVGPSLLALSIPGPHDEAFLAAIRAAVRQWRFRPAQKYHLEVTTDANGERQYEQSDRVDTGTWFDLSFSFTATGSVQIGPMKH